MSLAEELARTGDEVSLIGSGRPRSGTRYRFLHAPSVRRERFERFPRLPVIRSEYAYEELTFIPGFLCRYRPADYDVTLTASYPFTNWMLRRSAAGDSRPAHVFVTENGDWPAYARNSEYRFFHCDGLVCTNPDFYERNKTRWRCRLIPNGIDTQRFRPGPARRQDFALPADRLIVLMVSALIADKRVDAGIEIVSRIPQAHLVIAGDGPLRQVIDAKAARLLPGRFTRLSLAAERMPELYRCADVFFHLAREEAFGNVFLEALACGLPVIGHDTPRFRWLVGEQGHLVDSDDAAAVVRAIECARVGDPAKQAARIGHAAGFSWTRIAQMYRGFLQEIVASSGRHAA